jgi:uncharacterized oligopeptide transporter (OPT) family protein
VASAAGYMTGGGNMAALPALLMLTGARPDPVWMVGWFAIISMLGVFTAIPIKRQLIQRPSNSPSPRGGDRRDAAVAHAHGVEGLCEGAAPRVSALIRRRHRLGT